MSGKIVACEACNGTGTTPERDCPICQGTRKKPSGDPCGMCQGTGRVPAGECWACGGTGQLVEEEA